jgi:hypothetical protein
MKKVLVLSLLIIGWFVFAEPVHATHESKDLSREKKLFRNFSGEGSTSVSSFCIEGHVFLMVNGNVSNQTSIAQVYEERNGKVVPKSCETNSP